MVEVTFSFIRLFHSKKQKLKKFTSIILLVHVINYKIQSNKFGLNLTKETNVNVIVLFPQH